VSAPEDERPTLRTLGNVYVTLAAARAYARHEGCGEEEARRELTERMLDAKPVDRASQPERWRWRNRRVGLDISVQVVIEGPMAVVVHVGVREDSR
jgi:hypothetical protein